MLYQYLRVIYGDNGTLTDYSLDNQNHASTVPSALVTGEDYIYIAKYWPFNNFYIQVNTANDVASTMSIEHWDGSQWRQAVDVLDGTKSSTASLAQNGIVQFTPDKDYSWNVVDDTSRTQNTPTELRTLKIYDMYWIRISFNASLKAGSKLNTISYAFTRHQQLTNLDVTVNDYLTAFGAGKTSWDNEIMTASEQVLDHMRFMGTLRHEGQIIRFDTVSMATDYKTLSLIYSQLGVSYKDKRDYFEEMFRKTIGSGALTIDKNNDARVDKQEINSTTSFMVR